MPTLILNKVILCLSNKQLPPENFYKIPYQENFYDLDLILLSSLHELVLPLEVLLPSYTRPGNAIAHRMECKCYTKKINK